MPRVRAKTDRATQRDQIMTISLTARALLLASAVALAPAALPAAWAETPADTLVVAATIDDIISLDPAQSFEFSGNDVNQNTYDRLVDFDPLALDKGFQPSLAESWEVSEDGKTITLTMKEGVKFQSGNPVRAEDAAWSLQRAVKLDKSPAFILTQFGFTPENVDQMITAEGRTLTLRLDKPYAQSFVLNCLAASNAAVIDKETVMANAQGDDLGNAWLSTNGAGSGPYSLAAWRPNEVVQLVANDGYWGGAPAMKRVIVRNVQESSAQRLQLEQGDIDVARNLTPTDVEAVAERLRDRRIDFQDDGAAGEPGRFDLRDVLAVTSADPVHGGVQVGADVLAGVDVVVPPVRPRLVVGADLFETEVDQVRERGRQSQRGRRRTQRSHQIDDAERPVGEAGDEAGQGGVGHEGAGHYLRAPRQFMPQPYASSTLSCAPRMYRTSRLRTSSPPRFSNKAIAHESTD